MPPLPERIKVRVDYYDAEEEKLLLKAPYPAEAIGRVAGSVIEINVPDFFRAFLSHRIQTRPDIYKTFSKITSLEKAWETLEETVSLEGETVRWHPEAL